MHGFNKYYSLMLLFYITAYCPATPPVTSTPLSQSDDVNVINT